MEMKKILTSTILTFSICYCVKLNADTTSVNSYANDFDDTLQNERIQQLIRQHNDQVHNLERDMSKKCLQYQKKIEEQNKQLRMRENSYEALKYNKYDWQAVACLSLLFNFVLGFFTADLEANSTNNNKKPEPQKRRPEKINDSTANACKSFFNKYIKAIKLKYL